MEKIWYDSNRAGDERVSDSLGNPASNGIALLVVLVLVTGPVWNFIPSSLMPWGTPLGVMRFVICAFLCHVGLIFWPCAGIFAWCLVGRLHWLEWIKLAVLCGVFVWQAWGATHGVIWFWGWLYHGLAHFFIG